VDNLYDTRDASQVDATCESNMVETEFVNRVANSLARSNYRREDAILAAPICTFE